MTAVWTIPCFLSGGAAFFLAALIILRRKTGRVFLALVIVMAATGWIQLSNGMTFLYGEHLLFWRQMALIGELALPVALYQVGLSFTKHMSMPIEHAGGWRFGVLLILAIAFGVAVIGFPGALMTMVAETGEVVFQRPWGRVIWGFILVALVLALSELEHMLRASRDPLRYQIKFVVIGVGGMAGVAIAQAAHVLLFSVWQPEYVWMGAMAVFISIGLVVIGLRRWGTEDLSQKLYVSHQVLYTSFTFLIVGFYLIGVGILAEVVRQTGWALSAALGMLLLFVGGLALVVAVSSRQARAELQGFISRHFYSSKYDYRSKWLELTESFSACRSLDDIVDQFLNILGHTFGASKVTIWVKFQTDERFHQVRSLTVGPSTTSIPATHPVVAELERQKGPVTFSQEVAEGHGQLSRFVQGTRAVICVPLQTVSSSVIGFVTLSKELNGRQYVRDDFDLLRVMGHHVAMLLTQVKLMDEQRASAEWEAVHKFSAFYLHDLKNLASGLSLVSQNAEMYGDDPEFQASAMRTIGGTVQRIMALMGKLTIQLASPKVGIAPSFQVMNVNTVISEAVETLNGTACNPTFSPGVDLPQVPLVHEEFKHVVLNLLLNAQQALEDRGTIEITTKQDEASVYVIIRDNGRGIPEAQLRTLFQPFRTTKKKGLGIGLYQCKQIIEHHGGALRIESQEGHGTTVSIRLPYSHSVVSL